MILYEYPFNERIRTYLRLEHLLLRLAELSARDSAVDHHYALTTIFEVMDVATRADLKADVLRDLEKQKQVFMAYRDNPAIAQQALESAIGQLETCHKALNATTGKLAQSLAENDWLMSVRSRAVIPGGTCEFDLPAYHAWQHKPAAVRKADLQGWAANITPMAQGVMALLNILRDTGTAQKVMATGGQFQMTLPGRTFQLLRLHIDGTLDLVPEISANRLVVSIRLMRMNEREHRLQPSSQDAAFDMTLCA